VKRPDQIRKVAGTEPAIERSDRELKGGSSYPVKSMLIAKHRLAILVSSRVSLSPSKSVGNVLISNVF
jgi:hypothetical protein